MLPDTNVVRNRDGGLLPDCGGRRTRPKHGDTAGVATCSQPSWQSAASRPGTVECPINLQLLDFAVCSSIQRLQDAIPLQLLTFRAAAEALVRTTQRDCRRLERPPQIPCSRSAENFEDAEPKILKMPIHFQNLHHFFGPGIAAAAGRKPSAWNVPEPISTAESGAAPVPGGLKVFLLSHQRCA